MTNSNQGNGNTMDDKIGTLRERVSGLVDQGHEKVGQIKHRVIDAKDQAVTRGSAMLDRATDFIRTNPIKSVALAFGIGYLGMRIFRR